MPGPNQAGGDCVAVFDVGKTNQKILIYDQNLNLVDSAFEGFADRQENGVFIEDVEGIGAWFKSTLKTMARSHDIKAVSVTSHGATFACLDENGALALPVVSYTNEPGEEFHNRFSATFGGAKALQKETATPDYPGLGCLGKGVYYAQRHFPQGFAKTRTLLNLPQYYGYLLTGKAGVEPTYMGCTTFLWDHQAMDYSPMVDRLGIREMLPEKISRPWDVLGNISPAAAEETGLDPKTVVALGIHDSNSALLPYLIKYREGFVLNSTGTFCVAMHPSRAVAFAEEELGMFVFYNVDAFKQPVKTALFLGGMEYEIYTGILAGIHPGRPVPEFDQKVYEKIIGEKRYFIIPGGILGGGMFPESEARVVENGKSYDFDAIAAGGDLPDFFSDPEVAHAVVNLSLAIETQVAMERIGLEKGATIFVEGGFRNNRAYNNLLSGINPHSRVILTSLDEATAFGAAIIGKCAMDNRSPLETGGLFEIETQQVPSHDFTDLAPYVDAFLNLTRKGHAQ